MTVEERRRGRAFVAGLTNVARPTRWWAFLAIAFALIVGVGVLAARDIVVPVDQERYSRCLTAAKLDLRRVHCALDETVWDRTFSDPVAYYTAWLTLFTLALAFVGVGQGKLIADQISLTADEVAANHRPRIRVRNINVREVGHNDWTSREWRIHLPSIGDTFKGQLYVSNIGGSPARVREAHLMFYASNSPLPMERPYEGQDGNLLASSAWISPGGSAPVLFECLLISDDRPPGPNSFINEHNTSIYALGWVEYEDRRGGVLRTAFCRHYDPALLRFMHFPEAVPDYEAEE